MKLQHVEALCLGGPLHGQMKMHDKFEFFIPVRKEQIDYLTERPEIPVAGTQTYARGWYKFLKLQRSSAREAMDPVLPKCSTNRAGSTWAKSREERRMARRLVWGLSELVRR